MQPWETLSKEYILKSPWMNVRRDSVRLPTGVELPAFHVVELPDWAATVCITEDRLLLFVEQYRHGVGQGGLEFPAGGVDAAESPLEAAQRELLEETGYVSSNWTPLFSLAPEPSKHTNRAHLFVAQGATQHHLPNPEQSEDLVIHLLTVEETMAAFRSGRIIHGMHVAALLLAEKEGFLSP